MIFNLVVIVITLAIAWMWAMRGFFSALLHLVCVIVAGAIAFGVWEHLSMFLLNRVPVKGFLSGLEGSAWAVGLIVPFGASLALVRVLVDKAVPANIEVDPTWGFIGGGACGLASGTITAGILAIGIGTMWFQTDLGGYKRLEWDAATNTMARRSSLWYPADEMVAGLYGRLSNSTFQPHSGRTLGRLYPNLADVPTLMRTTLSDGEGRNTIRPDQFSLVSVYTVGLDREGNPVASLTVQDLVKDPLNQRNLTIADREGEPISGQGAYLAGFVTRVTSEARERGIGIFTVTPAQVRLVCAPKDGQGPWRELFPIAMVARADPEALEQRRQQQRESRGGGATGLPTGFGQDEDEQNDLAYYRYLSDRSALASVPSEETPTMAFEFVVPGGYEPVAYYVKNVRVDVRGRVDQRYPTPAQRQQAISSGAIAEGGQIEFEDAERVATFTRTAENWREHSIELRNRIPISRPLHSTRVGSLRVSDDEDQGKAIVGGTETIAKARLAERGVNRKLEVEQFAVTPNSELISIRVMPGTDAADMDALNLTRPPLNAAPLNEPIRLIDTGGNAYPCVGYVFQDTDTVRIRYTRSRPLAGLDDLPQVPSRPNPSIEIHLIFEVTSGASIEAFGVGNKIYQRFSPPIDTDD